MKKIAIALAVVFGAIVLFLTIEHFRGKWGLARWKARMAAKGELLTIGALTAPLPPANQNGMPALNVAAGQIGFFPSKILPPVGSNAVSGKTVVVTRLSSWRSRDRPATNVTWEILGEAVNSREAAVKAALKALDFPEFNSNVDYHAGWGTLLPHLSRLKHLQRTLNAAVLHCFHEGDLDAGIQMMAGAIRLLAALKYEACTVSHLVRFRMAREDFEITWQAAQAEGLSDAHLKQLQDAWSEHDFIKPLRRALSMEHVMTSHEYRRLRNTDVGLFQWLCMANPPRPWMMIGSPIDALAEVVLRTPEFLRDEIYSPLWKFTWSHQDELRFVKTVERGLRAWDAAIAEQSAVPLQPLGNAEYRDVMEDNDATEGRSLKYMLSPRAGRFFPVMNKAFVAQTLRELAMGGVALKRYELRYGKPAASLEALVPEFLPAVPRDFIDGKPLKYSPTNATMRLHSVGVDLRNDAGDLKSLVWPDQASPEEVEKVYPDSITTR